MNKKDLIDAVAKKTGLTKKDTGNVIGATFDAIVDYLGGEAKKSVKKRDNVQLIGFGTFEVKNRSARKGRNPQTGKEIKIPARKAPVFRAGKTFKDNVNA